MTRENPFLRKALLWASVLILPFIAYLYLLPVLNGTSFVDDGEASLGWILRGEAAQSIKLGILPLWDPLSGLGGDLSAFLLRIPIDYMALAQLLGAPRELIFFLTIVVALASFLIAASVIFREHGIAFRVIALAIFPFYLHVLYGLNNFLTNGHAPIYIAYLLLAAMLVHIERSGERLVEWKFTATAIAVYSIAGLGQQLYIWGFTLPVCLAVLVLAHRFAHGISLVQPRRDLAYLGVYFCSLALNSWAIVYHVTEALGSFRLTALVGIRMPAREVSWFFLQSLTGSSPLLVTAIYVSGSCLLLLFQKAIRNDRRTRARILVALSVAAMFMGLSGAWSDLSKDFILTKYVALNYAIAVGYVVTLGIVFLVPKMPDRVPRALVVLPLLHLAVSSLMLERLESTTVFPHVVAPAAASLLFASIFLSALHKNVRLSIFLCLNIAILIFIRSYLVVILEYGLHLPWQIDRDSIALSFAVAMLMLVGLHAVTSHMPERFGTLVSVVLVAVVFLAALSLHKTYIEDRTNSALAPSNGAVRDGHWSRYVSTARDLVRESLSLEPPGRPLRILMYNPFDAPIVHPGAFSDLGVVSLDYLDSLFLETGSRLIRQMPRRTSVPSKTCGYSMSLWHTLNVSKADPCSLQDRIRAYLWLNTTSHGFEERSIGFAQQHIDPDLVLVLETQNGGTAPVVDLALRTGFRPLSDRNIDNFRLSMWRSKAPWRAPVRFTAADRAVQPSAVASATATASEAFAASYYAQPILKQSFFFAMLTPSDGHADLDVAYSPRWRWSVNGTVSNAQETAEGMTRVPVTAGRNTIDAVFLPGLGAWLAICMAGIAVSIFAAVGLWCRKEH